MRRLFIPFFILIFFLTFLAAHFLGRGCYLSLIVTVPLFLWGLWDMYISKDGIKRNYPVLGWGRYFSEWMRPKVYQYFIEPDTDGRPFNRLKRNIVYSRAKGTLDTEPFGTQLNVYAEGYEWMNHSIAALDPSKIDHDQRILIGSEACRQKYSSSILNVSAMSFGSLGKNAIMALNGGAALGHFAQNTGEGGISPYHNKFGGDLIYQIGTAYFGCRSSDGNFDPELFRQLAAQENVRMIEIKLSQGAKPGHGGILPGRKVTEEIARIRNIEPFQDVVSPPYHKKFDSPVGLLKFVQECRELSGYKPVGFKLSLGHRYEFLAICKAMHETGILPDFITVDGGEGGTGAAPLEFSNSVGTPAREALSFVYNCLIGFNLKQRISLLYSGKIVTGFDIFRAVALGADACYSARAMMMSLGCIQALQCNRNTCPTGVATQDPALNKGLHVEDKKHKVARYHRETVKSFVELMAAAGIDDANKINRTHIYQRIDEHKSLSLYRLYPYIPESSLLSEDAYPRGWATHMALADAHSFRPKYELVYIEKD